MTTQFSAVIPAQASGDTGSFSVKNIDLQELGVRASPIAVLDDFRVRGRPFPPHPHAGFSAVTYVLEDSEGSLRSRDSLGNDTVVGPGGIVWTQAGSGVIHEELPAESDRELHGIQIFVNLSSKSKLAAPQVYRLEKDQVPEWRSAPGDRVRVVVGSFEDLSSPLVPTEPFHLLDVELHHEISFGLREGHNALVYVLTGEVLVQADDGGQKVPGEHALAVHGGGERLAFQALRSAHFLVLSATEIREPVVARGPFIMNDREQIEAAFARFRMGAMGRLSPLPER